MVSDNISQDITIRGEGNIVVGKGDVIINPPPPAEARLRHDLGILLKNVENTWIKGVLEKSVHEAALLELGMELREDSVDNPWRMIMEGPGQTPERLPTGKKIKDIFYEANGLLLILGEPGSGKTTTLLQLARDLIAEADQAFTQPVPVILNLSTWINRHQPLDDWLVAELNNKYRLPKRDGKNWLKERRILPLLDGLDEVKPENRAACVEKINHLLIDFGLPGLVVCSRIKEYTDINIRLAFYRAIYIQPLTPGQVDEYLSRAGGKLASLRANLQEDQALRGMAQSPLILSIMSLAYENTSADSLGRSTFNTEESRRKLLFDTYVARMFNRKAGSQLYDNEQTKVRLSWFARNMQQRNQELFSIEGLQPSWLPTRSWQWIYFFTSRLVSVLIFELMIEVGTGIVVRWMVRSTIIGLSAGLLIGFIDILRSEWLNIRSVVRKLPLFWWVAINIVIVWLVVALIESLISPELMGLSSPSGERLIIALIVGLVFGARGSRQTLENDIQTVDALKWSWRRALLGGLIGWLIALLFFMLINVVFGPIELLFAFLGVPIGAVFYGLSREIVETKPVPNQGLRLSIRNAVFGGLFVWLSFGLAMMPVSVSANGSEDGKLYMLLPRLIDEWMFELRVNRFAGFIGVLWFGGLDVIQHYVLRLFLIIHVNAPANYAHFLDYASDLIFLQKVGGGYRFIHRLLLEHFADMYSKSA